MAGEILDAVLAHVPFDGWSERAIQRAATDLELTPAFVKLTYPKGAVEMIEAFWRRADLLMLRSLNELDVASMSVRDRIKTAVRVRLDREAPYREAVSKAMQVLALPQNADLALKATYRTVDDIWAATGDTSTDINFYTKRATLAGVYMATVLYWIGDESEDSEDTWAFWTVVSRTSCKSRNSKRRQEKQ